MEQTYKLVLQLPAEAEVDDGLVWQRDTHGHGPHIHVQRGKQDPETDLPVTQIRAKHESPAALLGLVAQLLESLVAPAEGYTVYDGEVQRRVKEGFSLWRTSAGFAGENWDGKGELRRISVGNVAIQFDDEGIVSLTHLQPGRNRDEP